MEYKVLSAIGCATRKNEDFVLMSDQVLVLLDGAGGPSEFRSGCKHGVTWYVRQLGTRLLRNMCLDNDVSLPDALRGAIVEVASLHRGVCALDEPGTPSSTVAAVRLLNDMVEYLVLADSTVAFQLTSGYTSVTDTRVQAAVDSALKVYGDKSPGTPEHAALREFYVREFQKGRNCEDGYWVAAENPEAVDYALTGSIDIREVKSLIAMSDGAAALITHYGQLTWEEAFRRLATPTGPEKYLDFLRSVERGDADCKKWPRTKPHDDATLIFCERIV